MNKLILHEKGFTLIEQLLILLVLSILLSIMGGKIPNIIESAEAKRQVNIMKQDLQLASYTAFIKKTRVHVEIHPPHVSYQVIDQKSNEVIASYQHKKGSIKTSTFSQGIYFNANGHPSSGGSLIVEFGSQSYKLTIYLGSGRIHVQKQ
ncbi:competence type IV pilus minor pilin ComGD [Bacillus safensis]|uniref:competence type IV pilus minor pilin ComGD n=1 Tax=Bacillus safensis TaxID=561879 RepID=UPI0018CCBEB0|nr:competence type IV pilus minor pilin ComGD [Bacillus safensis]MBG9818265.1 competence protein ComGD [Bacillus safensis]QRF30939.1 type II secretion system protein [Bacillus safensis]WAT79310.1 competence type IV pilus minor pilin ComGD [Bacillus safensis]